MAKVVLVVEDDKDLRDSVVELIQSQGYDTRAAENGRAALECVDEQLPALILLDMNMPVMSGWEFARIFREHHDHAAPIVVVTAGRAAPQAAGEINAENWLSKPFTTEELFSTIQHHVGAA